MQVRIPHTCERVFQISAKEYRELEKQSHSKSDFRRRIVEQGEENTLETPKTMEVVDYIGKPKFDVYSEKGTKLVQAGPKHNLYHIHIDVVWEGSAMRCPNIVNVVAQDTPEAVEKYTRWAIQTSEPTRTIYLKQVEKVDDDLIVL